MKRIHISDVEGKSAVCFDTGLDPRSFARTKMSQSLIESGYIVYPDGKHEVWKPSGVNELDGYMRVWGPSFEGERLDLILERAAYAARGAPAATQQTTSQQALQAVTFWIRAKILLGDTHSTLNPGAAFIICEDGKSYPKGSVFFAPAYLSNRCLIGEGMEIDRYNCPDLIGMEAAAFCAAVMLYKVLVGSHPYPAEDVIFQDMREGVFLPPRLACPVLDKKLSDLIQSALLLPVENKRTSAGGTDIITGMLRALTENENVVSLPSLFIKLPQEENERLEKEKRFFLFRQNAIVKTKRFALRNKYVLIGSAIGVLFVLFVIVSTTMNVGRRPTTEGMSPDSVIMMYYDAFSALDHVLMEACIQGADKTDLNAAVSLYAITKTRQATEMSTSPVFIQARVWKEVGNELPAPNVFGVTDLTLERLAGSETDGMVIYRADYLLWPPEEYSLSRSDVLTLSLDRKKNWRITEILRTER